MKKATIIGLIVVLVFAMTSCGAKPESAIDNFFGAVKNFDYTAMTKAMAPSATENLGSASEYLKASKDPVAAPFLDYLKGNAKKITYEITGTKVNGDEATVTVKCKYVDGTELFGKIIKELFTKIMAEALSGKTPTQEQMTQMGVDLLKADIGTAKETFVEKTVDVTCVQVDGKWYVKTVSDQLADVVSSNLFTAAKELAGTLGK
jgi:hypothetical protein